MLPERITLDSYHPFDPPATRAAWEARRAALRRQVLVAAGLWPLPERPALQPVIHGAVEREGYTVAEVFFASLPGHYVSGNLYRPSAPADAPRAAVLSPHGHWHDGRFTELDDEVGNDRWPLQARCAQLARLGCVVFHYDMVGYADSTAIAHAEGFTDAAAVRDGHTFLGLQLWNSIRALDFLASLPDVDPERIGVTGASGGGTQTFLLCAVDERPAAAFPAVMVSTGMQGGCICENAPYLRLGTGNVELAALMAPRPLALSGADDWTIDIETQGLPELKRLYALYDAADRVTARCWPEYPHNFNRAAREMMYGWFNEHLGLGHEGPIVEQELAPLTREELTVYTEAHPRPADEGGAEAVRRWWSARNHHVHAPAGPASLREWECVFPAALEVLLGPLGEDPPARPSVDRVVVVYAGGERSEREWLTWLADAGAEVRTVPLPAEDPPIDERRHASYAGYSWAYNPTSVAFRAGLIRRELLAARGSAAVRLLGGRGESVAAFLALASAGEASGVDRAIVWVDEGLLAVKEPWEEGYEHKARARAELAARDTLPGIGRFGFVGFLPLAARAELSLFGPSAETFLGRSGTWWKRGFKLAGVRRPSDFAREPTRAELERLAD